MPYGIVSHFQFSKNIGFIRCPELHKENIYFHISRCIPGYNAVQIGDEVNFSLHAIDSKKSEARDISLLGNPGLDELISSFHRRLSRTGRLVKFGKRFLVEDEQTGIFIKIEFGEDSAPSAKESGPIENEWVNFTIVSVETRNDLIGTLTNENSIDIQPILNGESTLAVVDEIVKGGFSIRFLDYYFGFIPFQLATRNQMAVSPGDQLDVTLIRADLKSENFVFDLTQNYQEKENRRFNRIRAIPEFRIGESCKGTISHTVSYGVFVSLGETDGFLHISEILGENCQIPSTSKRRMSNAMKEVFQTGATIDVEVKQLSRETITLTWEPMSAINFKLFDRIISLYKKLKSNNSGWPFKQSEF